MDRRIHIVLSDELMADLDRLVGKRGRSRFIEEAVRSRLRHDLQMAAIRKAAANPVKFDLDLYPELATPEGTSEWVHRMRQEDTAHRDAKIAARLRMYDEDQVASATS